MSVGKEHGALKGGLLDRPARREEVTSFARLPFDSYILAYLCKGFTISLLLAVLRTPYGAVSHLVSRHTAASGINRFSLWTRRPTGWKRESSVLRDYVTRSDVCPLLSWHGRQVLARKKCDFRAVGKHFERSLLNSLDIYARFSVSANSRLIYCSHEKR